MDGNAAARAAAAPAALVPPTITSATGTTAPTPASPAIVAIDPGSFTGSYVVLVESVEAAGVRVERACVDGGARLASSTFAWDGTLLAISDGEETVVLGATLASPGTKDVLSVPCLYTHAGVAFEAALQVSRSTLEPIAVFSVSSSVAAGTGVQALAPQPGDSLALYEAVSGPSGPARRLSRTLTIGKAVLRSLALGSVPAPTGTYEIVVTAQDGAGHSAQASASVTVP